MSKYQIGSHAYAAVKTFAGEFSWLSNFAPVEVFLDGMQYPSVEHAYAAAKTMDMAERRLIQGLPSAGRAKRYGRRLKLREGWEALKLPVMENLLRQKFVEGSELAAKLLQTGEAELVEGNHWRDNFWGVQLPCGEGQNHLGRLLMLIRSELSSNTKTGEAQ